VFLVGALFLLVLGALDVRLSNTEDSLLYIAALAYFLYVASSMTLAFSVSPTAGDAWPVRYLLSMAPVTLLTSWMLITVAWPWNLTHLSDPMRQLLSASSNLVLCYASGWVLLLIARALSPRVVAMRVVVVAASAIVPIVMWVFQGAIALHVQGLV
jgi:hypothetical protein